MQKIATKAFEKLFEKYPLYSQSEVSDPLVIARLFMPCGTGVWYVTEFDPETKNAFGFVEGLGGDEFGYFSIEEIESVTLPNLPIPAVERDLYFDSKPLSEAKQN